MGDALIVDAVRTPFGKEGGVFRDTHPEVLGAQPLLGLEERNGFDPADTIEDVIYGCVTPVDKQGGNIGRQSTKSAWGDATPGVQLNRMCGSGQQAVQFGAAVVKSGFHDVVIAGGVEHMTDHPIGADSGERSGTYLEHFDERTQELLKTSNQFEGAERIAEKWDITREEADQIGYDSQQRWKEAWDAGYYDDQIVPVETELDGETITVDTDEHPRPDTDMETLSELPLVVREEGNGIVHPGNASGIVDGSSAMLLANEEAVEEHGWDPMARIVDTHVVVTNEVTILTGPIDATNELLEQNDMTVDDIDVFECNEAFAPVVDAWMKETDADWARTNIWGGAIAHGHPLGATGSALMTKVAHQLHETGQDYGLSTLCIGGGQGVAAIIERL